MLLDLYFHHTYIPSGVRRTPGAYQQQEEYLEFLKKRDAKEKVEEVAAPAVRVEETFAEEKTFREPEARPVTRRRVIAATYEEPPQPPVVYELLQELNVLFGELSFETPVVEINKRRQQTKRRRAAALLLLAA